jgi:hypothetical protein
MRFLTTLLFLGALALGQTSEEDDIREAVFRQQFEHNASGQKQNANAYYLCGPGKNRDLPAGFMKRFASHKHPSANLFGVALRSELRLSGQQNRQDGAELSSWRCQMDL